MGKGHFGWRIYDMIFGLFLFGSTLRQTNDPIKEINHLAVGTDHTGWVVTRPEQASGFIFEIAVSEEPTSGER
jgi:hypothetical protein